MGNRLRRSQKSLILVLGAATFTLLWLPSSTHAQAATPPEPQSAATQQRQAIPGDEITDVTRMDLAQFDRFLDSHREIADQLRRTPSLIDDPQFLQSHPELNAYLQEHPSVKQEISQQPGTFMRLEDLYARDKNLRDRDAAWQDRGQDQDARRADLANFNRFLDDHREIAQQVRRDPSLCDNRDFVRNHPALQTYFQDNPGVRDQLRQDPNTFMQQADLYARDQNLGDRDPVGQDRDASHANLASFDRFLDGHREISELVRRDPSLCDNRDFVQNHPPLQAYLRDNPGVRDQLRQDPRAFMQQADLYARDSNLRDRGMDDRMADFRGFLGSHPDIRKDLSRDPSVVQNQDYVQDHAELDAYLSAHPDVRDELMANPQSFVQGAQQYNYNNGSGSGTSTTETSTGTSANPATTPHTTKPNPNQ